MHLEEARMIRYPLSLTSYIYLYRGTQIVYSFTVSIKITEFPSPTRTRRALNYIESEIILFICTVIDAYMEQFPYKEDIH